MPFLQQLGADFASRLMGRLMPTEGERYYSQLAKAKAEAEMKGLQRLDEPIYKAPAEYDYSDEFAATGIAPGKMTREAYESPITNRMMTDWNLQPGELPERDIAGLKLRPQPRKETRPKYDIFKTPEGYKYLPEGSQIPEGYKPYVKPSGILGQLGLDETSLLPGQAEPGEPTIYVFEVDGKKYNIPAREAEEFMRAKPNAKRIK